MSKQTLEEWWAETAESNRRALQDYQHEEARDMVELAAARTAEPEPIPWTAIIFRRGNPRTESPMYFSHVHAPTRAGAVLCARRDAALDLIDGKRYLLPMDMVECVAVFVGHHDPQLFQRD